MSVIRLDVWGYDWELCESESGEYVHYIDYAALESDNARLRGALEKLTALVRGECPRLLDETRGGDAGLDAEIKALADTTEGAA